MPVHPSTGCLLCRCSVHMLLSSISISQLPVQADVSHDSHHIMSYFMILYIRHFASVIPPAPMAKFRRMRGDAALGRLQQHMPVYRVCGSSRLQTRIADIQIFQFTSLVPACSIQRSAKRVLRGVMYLHKHSDVLLRTSKYIFMHNTWCGIRISGCCNRHPAGQKSYWQQRGLCAAAVCSLRRKSCLFGMLLNASMLDRVHVGTL